MSAGRAGIGNGVGDTVHSLHVRRLRDVQACAVPRLGNKARTNYWSDSRSWIDNIGPEGYPAAPPGPTATFHVKRLGS